MRVTATAVAVALLCCHAHAADLFAVQGDRAVAPARSAAPRPWRSAGDASPADTLNFVVAVYQRNGEALSSLLRERSDPTSSSYGRWLDVEQINAIVGNPLAIREVVGWLREGGVPHVCIRDHGDAVAVKNVSVSVAVALFQTQVRRRRRARAPAASADCVAPPVPLLRARSLRPQDHPADGRVVHPRAAAPPR